MFGANINPQKQQFQHKTNKAATVTGQNEISYLDQFLDQVEQPTKNEQCSPACLVNFQGIDFQNGPNFNQRQKNLAKIKKQIINFKNSGLTFDELYQLAYQLNISIRKFDLINKIKKIEMAKLSQCQKEQKDNLQLAKHLLNFSRKCDQNILQSMQSQNFVKKYKGRTVYINEEPDRANPYLNSLAVSAPKAVPKSTFVALEMDSNSVSDSDDSNVFVIPKKQEVNQKSVSSQSFSSVSMQSDNPPCAPKMNESKMRINNHIQMIKKVEDQRSNTFKNLFQNSKEESLAAHLDLSKENQDFQDAINLKGSKLNIFKSNRSETSHQEKIEQTLIIEDSQSSLENISLKKTQPLIKIQQGDSTQNLNQLNNSQNLDHSNLLPQKQNSENLRKELLLENVINDQIKDQLNIIEEQGQSKNPSLRKISQNALLTWNNIADKPAQSQIRQMLFFGNKNKELPFHKNLQINNFFFVTMMHFPKIQRRLSSTKTIFTAKENK